MKSNIGKILKKYKNILKNVLTNNEHLDIIKSTKEKRTRKRQEKVERNKRKL